MRLSDRLQEISNNIDPQETMADIGTDHGFLPLYLWETKKCSKVIMSDISKGSLEKARSNCKMYYPDEKFDLRLGSGIEVLQNGEVNAVVIAGMGGILMAEILGLNIQKAHSFDKLILQPRNSIGKLRFWLSHNGFQIKRESLVREGKYIWEILNVVNGNTDGSFDNDDENSIVWELPMSLVENPNKLTAEFLEKKLSIENFVREKVLEGKIIDYDKLNQTDKRIEYIDILLKKLER
ncbi:MAG: class I SAM-dependent methyltransferase [Anaerovoracaceae bacterium]